MSSMHYFYEIIAFFLYGLLDKFLIHFLFISVVIQAQWGIQMSQPVTSRRNFQLLFVKRQPTVHHILKDNQFQENILSTEEAKPCHRYHYMERWETFRVGFQLVDHLHLLSKSNEKWCKFRHTWNKNMREKCTFCLIFHVLLRVTHCTYIRVVCN